MASIDLGTSTTIVYFNDTYVKFDTVLTEYNNILYFGNDAINISNKHGTQLIYELKRLIGKTYDNCSKDIKYLNYEVYTIDNNNIFVKINDKTYEILFLYAELFKYIKSLIHPIDTVIVTVPAYFNNKQRNATLKAIAMAKLKCIRLLNEPTAAALAYYYNGNFKLHDYIYVLDIGGGTTDASLLYIKDHDNVEVIETNGNSNLGGKDIDNMIINVFLNDDKSRRNEAIEIKKYYSTDNNDYINKLRNIYYIFMNSVLNLLDTISKKTNDIILVGSQTKSPFVHEYLSKLYNVHSHLDPETVVAQGAYQYYLNMNKLMLVECVPMSIGVELKGGLMDFVIKKYTKLPCKKIKYYTNGDYNVDDIIINIYEGNHIFACKNTYLGALQITINKRLPVNTLEISVCMSIDNNGILHIKACEHLTSNEIETSIKYYTDINQDEDTYEDITLYNLIKFKENISVLNNIYEYYLIYNEYDIAIKDIKNGTLSSKYEYLLTKYSVDDILDLLNKKINVIYTYTDDKKLLNLLSLNTPFFIISELEKIIDEYHVNKMKDIVLLLYENINDIETNNKILKITYYDYLLNNYNMAGSVIAKSL